jgi:hypothetical protein
MRILYLGPRSGTSLHRFHALKRLGHDADIIDPRPPILAATQGSRWTVFTGALGVSGLVRSWLQRGLAGRRYDLAIVDGGELIGPDLMPLLRSAARAVINYNPDNPYVARDGRKWRLFLKALPHYDLVVTPRASSAEQAAQAGARKVLQVSFAADEVVHRPPDPPRDRSLRVVFVGTWMPERGPFLLELLSRGVPLGIFGPGWRKAPEFGALGPHVQDRYLDDGPYVSTIASAKIGLALLSVGNQDLHTTRSLEIPAIGTLLCAERTADHCAMYREDQEAVFWSSAEECAAQCLKLLADPTRIAAIARAGYERSLKNGFFNEALLVRMIEAAGR